MLIFHNKPIFLLNLYILWINLVLSYSLSYYKYSWILKWEIYLFFLYFFTSFYWNMFYSFILMTVWRPSWILAAILIFRFGSRSKMKDKIPNFKHVKGFACRIIWTIPPFSGYKHSNYLGRTWFSSFNVGQSYNQNIIKQQHSIRST